MKAKIKKHWTQEEDLYLLTFGNNLTCKELQSVLKVSRSQLDHRCLVLSVSPKKLKKHKHLTEAEKKICLEKKPSEAAKILDIHIQSARRCRRKMIEKNPFNERSPIPKQFKENQPIKSVINFAVSSPVVETEPLAKLPEPDEATWTSQDDRILVKRISNNSIDKVAELFGKSEEEIKERFDRILKEEKSKIGIHEILSAFPNLMDDQIQMMKDIYTYSPKSAMRYCEVVSKFAAKKSTQIERLNESANYF